MSGGDARAASVTVVLPARDAGRTVAAAVRSVLLQTRDDWTLLVVDDGSRDDTVAQALAAADSDARVHVLADGRSLGLPDRLNETVGAISTRFLARMDADDVAFPDRLERQIAFLEENPQVDLVAGSAVVFAAGGRARGRRGLAAGHASICSHPGRGFPMMHPTWVGRTAWFRAHPYDPRAVRCEDQDLLLRTWRSSEFASLGDLVLGYREERLRIRASLEARRALASSYRRHGVGTPAAARQIGLGVVDAATALARLDEARLRRRVTALTAADAARWTALWADVGGDQRA